MHAYLIVIVFEKRTPGQANEQLSTQIRAIMTQDLTRDIR